MHDLVIIGAGPAGLTAGLYAGRFRLDTLILEKMSPGGQIVLSPSIDNFPGLPAGTATFGLVERLRQQVEEVGVAITSADVQEIEFAEPGPSVFYKVRTPEETYEARTVIIATGAEPKRLGVPSEDRLTGRGVSYCATCDGPLFRDKDVVVVGGGDRAVEEALFLTSYAARVTLVHRRDQLRASKILEEKARKDPRIVFLLDTVLEDIVGKERVEAVEVRNVKTQAPGRLPCQGVFIFVGTRPNTGFLSGRLVMDEAGFIVTAEDMSTSCAGVFACGDCRKKSLYQVITACGDGATAAASAQRYLL